MAGFNDVLKSIGYGVGVVTGGPSQVKAVAGTVAAQGKINTYLQQFGKSIGGVVGADIFKQIGSGADVSANKETRAFVDKNIFTPQAKYVFSLGLAGLIVLLGYFMYRK